MRMQVVHDIIVPAVTEKRCRYVDLIPANASSASSSSDANYYFISHGWARPFVELVDQLTTHFSPWQQTVWRWGEPVLQSSQVRHVSRAR